MHPLPEDALHVEDLARLPTIALVLDITNVQLAFSIVMVFVFL
jgi:hypothetical protein